MATVQLSEQEISLLVTHLERRLAQLDRDLVRTDNPGMQHALAREVEELRAIVRRFESVGGTSMGASAVR